MGQNIWKETTPAGTRRWNCPTKHPRRSGPCRRWSAAPACDSACSTSESTDGGSFQFALPVLSFLVCGRNDHTVLSVCYPCLLPPSATQNTLFRFEELFIIPHKYSAAAFCFIKPCNPSTTW